MVKILNECGFEKSEVDPCLFLQKIEDGMVYIAIYVDDIVIVSETVDDLEYVKSELGRRFEMKDLERLHFCLGISVEQTQDRSQISIYQRQYIHDMLVKFGMLNANVVSTPVDVNVKLQMDDGVSQKCDPIKYQSMVGSLLFCNRPDISQAVAMVSKFNCDPAECHL